MELFPTESQLDQLDEFYGCTYSEGFVTFRNGYTKRTITFQNGSKARTYIPIISQKKPITLFKLTEKKYPCTANDFERAGYQPYMSRFRIGTEEQFADKLRKVNLTYRIGDDRLIQKALLHASGYRRYLQDVHEEKAKKLRKEVVKMYRCLETRYDHGWTTRLFERDYSNIYEALATDANKMATEAFEYQHRFTTGKGGRIEYDGQTIVVPKMRFYLQENADDPYVAVVIFDNRIGGWVKHSADSDVVIHKSGKVYVTRAGVEAIPFLDVFAQRGLTSEFAKLFDQCAICGKQLTDATSLDLKMGPVCSKRWNNIHAVLKRIAGNNGSSVIKNSTLKMSDMPEIPAVMKPHLETMMNKLREAMPDGPIAVLSEMGGDIIQLIADYFGVSANDCDEALMEMGLMIEDPKFKPFRQPYLVVKLLKWIGMDAVADKKFGPMAMEFHERKAGLSLLRFVKAMKRRFSYIHIAKRRRLD